jgi:uncharacterized membrane protein YfcA
VTLFLFFAGFAGGALNSVAGGGSFIALPAMLYAGVAPVIANATTTLAMWPGSLASALAYRREVRVSLGWLEALGLVSLAGGLAGGLLLMGTTDAAFLRLLPWLMLLAATIGGRITARFGSAAREDHPARPSIWGLLFQLVIATYGGYFGGGMGIMMLAALSVSGMTDIHKMNGVKAVLAVLINGVALIEFVALGAIAWPPGLVTMTGAVAGGYAGAAFARTLPHPLVRAFVVTLSWVMTFYFFVA